MHSPKNTCRHCGEPLDSSALSGNCPQCLAGQLLASPAAPMDLGDVKALRRLGDYELLEEIARGGMGIVYRARQVSLNRTVAVKLMRDSALAGVEDVRRFKVEAGAAARLKHPNIVTIHEVGEAQGQHYFAMDLVEGLNLAQRTREGRVPSASVRDGVLPTRHDCNRRARTCEALARVGERHKVFQVSRRWCRHLLPAVEGWCHRSDQNQPPRVESLDFKTSQAGSKVAG